MARSPVCGGAAALAAVVWIATAHAQPAPAVHTWSWNPADSLVRVEAQVFVDESNCSNICFDNTINGPWHDPACAPPTPPPQFWHWSILPPVPPPAPPPPPATPPVDWDEYAPPPPPLALGTIYVGDYCPCPSSDDQGNPPPPVPTQIVPPFGPLPLCGLDWFMRVAYHAPLGLVFQNMLGHPSLAPEMQVVNWAFASDGDVPWATVPCFNAPFVPPDVEVTGEADQVVTVRGRRGLIGTVAHQGVRTWEIRYTNGAQSNVYFTPGADRYVAEACATIVTQIPLEITGLTPGVQTRFTFEFQTLGEARSLKEDHFYLDPNFDPHIRSDADNAYSLAMVNLYVEGIWSTQFVQYAGDPPGFPAGTFPPVSGNQGGATFIVTPTQTTYPVVLRLTGRSRVHLEDDATPSFFDEAFASIRANVWLTVFGPPIVGGLEHVPAGGPGPAYDFWIGKYEVSNVEFVDFLNDAEADAAAPGGGTAKSAYMAFDPTTGQVSTLAGVLMFSPISSPTPGGGSIQKIRYRPFLPAGTRYVVDSGAEPDAVIGVSWVGAVKYCNWLTLHVGYPPSDRCYTEGDTLDDWHPVTISTADWAAFGDLDSAQRADLVANYRGFRLPMDNLGTALGYRSNQANEFNEWYKASAYDPTAPNVARIGPGGETVPPLHWIYGFGRDTIGGEDANFVNSGDPFDDGVAHIGYFDGVNILPNGVTTSDTDNPYGLYDMAGNVDEWGQDQGPGFQLGPNLFPGRITRTGSWQGSDAQAAASRRDQAGPASVSTRIGFRVLTTHEPPTPTACPGDVNGDGVIDLADLSELLTAYGTQAGDPGFNPDADFDGDGMVGLGDLSTLLGVFGTACP